MRGEFVDVGGARMYYYAAGSRGSGEPVVFLHGFPTSSHLWRDVVAHVPDGHRAIVVDLLGYGRSDRPLGRPLGIPAHGTRILALLDDLGVKRACIVGHDLGGGIAQWLAARHPARVAGLCLVNSVSLSDWPAREMRVARAIVPVTRHLPPTWLRTALRAELTRGYADRSRGARSVDMYLRPFADMVGCQAFWEHLSALDHADTEALVRPLRTFAQPTTIVWGEDDPFLPVTSARRLQEVIPGATLQVVPGARHFTPEDAPDQVGIAVTTLLAR
ncbi:MAG: alpha/beta hydrolase [Gemmatimonadaceae bacterium]